MMTPPADIRVRAVRPRLGSRSGFARALAAAWLLLYGGIGIGLPVLDARSDHATPVVAHWEDSSDTSCPPRHDPATCVVCQQLVLGGRLPADRAEYALLNSRRAAPPAFDEALRLSSAARYHPASRAPPSA